MARAILLLVVPFLTVLNTVDAFLSKPSRGVLNAPTSRHALFVAVDGATDLWTMTLASTSSTSTSTWLSDAATLTGDAAVAAATEETGLLSNEAIIAIFLVGLFPFAVATFEFWRRIAVGESFGTGTDSVVFTTIGQDNVSPMSSRGRRVLGQGAMITAYVLFAVSAAVLGLVLYAVVSSGMPPASLPSSPSLPPS